MIPQPNHIVTGALFDLLSLVVVVVLVAFVFGVH